MSTKGASISLKDRLHELRMSDIQDCMTKERIWEKMNRLHTLYDFCVHSAGTGKPLKKPTYPDELEEQLSGLLDIARNLYELLEEFQDTVKAAEFNKVARMLGTGSDLVSMFEEFYTGEDPLKDVLLNTVPFVLSRLEETAYIKSAEEGFRTLFQRHTLNLYERFWKLARERSVAKSGYSYEESLEIGKRMDDFRRTLSDRGLDRQLRFVLHVILYMVLYNRKIEEILNSVVEP